MVFYNFKMEKLIITYLLLISTFTFADCQNIKLSTAKSKTLVEAIQKYTGKTELPSMIHIECAYDGPGAGDDCHGCKKGMKCTPCSALKPEHPDYCSVDDKRYENIQGRNQLGKVLEKLKTGSSHAMGGWYSHILKALVCKQNKKKQFTCEYDACQP